MTRRKVNLAAAFALIDEHWSPKQVAAVDGYDVRLAKIQGEYHWHRHERADELFLCVDGSMAIELRDGAGMQEVTLTEGELFVVPAGTEHRPSAENEAHILLLERHGTESTGD